MSCCALLGTRSRWDVSIRYGVKCHVARGNGWKCQEETRLWSLRNMDAIWTKWGEGGFNGCIICSPRPALLPYSTLRPAVHLLPCHYPSDALSAPKSPRCRCFLPRREPRRSWPGPETVPSALLYRDIPFRGKHLHLAVHHNRPITVSSLDRWRRREKPSREGVSIAQRGGGLASPWIPLYPPESARSRVRQPIDA